MATKGLSIRIDENLLQKLHIVATHEERSTNSQILILIRDAIKDFEKKHRGVLTATSAISTRGLTIRLEEDMLRKISIIANCEDRSVNGKILLLIRDCIEDFEEKHGKIEL